MVVVVMVMTIIIIKKIDEDINIVGHVKEITMTILVCCCFDDTSSLGTAMATPI